MHCTARFDNSTENLANPDPTESVRFGDQTWEEMMFGFYTAVDPNEQISLANGKATPATVDSDEQGGE
jgi:hypothetical protein